VHGDPLLGRARDARAYLFPCAAHAVGRADRIGSLTPGKQADLLVLDSPSIEHIPYLFARNPVRHVVKRGRVFTP
jgi:imidazolonepropionase-like amidohydrolase